MNKLKFDELELSPSMKKAIADMGFEEASPIQSEAIPPILAGQDVIGQAQTGTGKTAAFAIPLIENLDRNSKDIQALVLCPTRELVIQVTEEFHKLMKYMANISVVPIYGGQEMDRQLKALKKRPQVVVGTPGRLMDHMRRGSIRVQTVRQVVLDEADEMLDMGFRDDIEIILKDTPADRQTVMFSATMSEDILRLVKHYQREPKRIDVSYHKVDAPKIDQAYFEIQEKAKPEALARLLDFHNIKLALVFCNTRSQVDTLVEILKSRGYFAEGLHGDMSQKQRDRVMGGFRTGRVDVLVATDVAGRGIDVNDIGAVFNYDLPRDDEDYIHRIGRTGRMGKTGKAFTFIVGRQIYNLKRIERTNAITIPRHKVPSLDDLDETRMKSLADAIRKAAEKGTQSRFLSMVESLMGEEYTAMDIAAALLKVSIDSRNEAFDAKVDFEGPAAHAGKKPMRGKPGYADKPYGRKPAHAGPSRFAGKTHDGKPKRTKKPFDGRPGFPEKTYDGKPAHSKKPYESKTKFNDKTFDGKPVFKEKPGGGKPKFDGTPGKSRARLENKFYEKKAQKTDKRRKD
jgi:ATP-dependent RNA helicase DeaD